jgi:hypothetical protein
VTTGSFLHLAFALAHMAVLVVLVRHRTVPGARIIAAVALLLVVDNAVLVAGSFLGEGGALRSLSLVRFAGHAIVTPLLVVAVRSLADASSVRWVAGRAARWSAVVVAAGLVVFGVATDLVGLDLSPVREGGVLRYHDPSGGPPLAAILTLVVVIVLSVPMVRRAGGPAPLVGALLMFVASALDPLVEGPVVGNAGEVALLLGLAAGVRRVGRDRTEVRSA